MLTSRSLRRALLIAGTCLLTSYSYARNHSKAIGDLLDRGRQAEERLEYERAISTYEELLRLDSGNQTAAMALRRARFHAGQKHLTEGVKLREAGDLAAALREFEAARAIDPDSMGAAEEAARTARMLDDKPLADGAPVLADVPRLAPAVAQLSQLVLHNETPEVMFCTLGKLAGINVMFDPNLPPSGRRYTVDLSNETLDQALEELSVLTRCFWKTLSPKTIFVTQDNPQNRRDYEDQVMQVFYLKNITAPPEIQEVANVLRVMLDIRRVLVYSSQNAVFVRGTADQVVAASKLIQDMDKTKAEVVVDVLVMETTRTRSRQISAALSGSAALGIPVTFTPGGSSSSSTIPLSKLKHLSSADYSVALPGFSLVLDASDSSTRILQSPQVRASDGQKASLRIGQRIPYATGSFNGGTAASGSGLLVSTQFQYADVGVNVDLVPRVHGRDELTLHIEIEVSSVADHVTIGDISQPVIGQRKVSHEVRLKEGQATVLAGLAESQDDKTITGLPGLLNVPGLRRLFGSDKLDRKQSDLLIVLIPHLVRCPAYSPANLLPAGVGTDAIVRVKRN